MKFQDVLVSREHMFSVGIEQDSGRFYVSIPVSNGMADYEEYYEINQATFELFKRDPDAALPFVARCRKRELDELLIVQPGTNRGTAI
ncbi:MULTISPECIES: hypothetical protein [Pseudomonas]|jgi:hypothetical protein|uniref:hypothetical protein n=1 Tax=Pseudomonas TaxID=286 RepID=UPI001BDF3F98|nr:MULTISPECIES: hypothetical protein [Pseudomonas]MCP1453254.1 hypothetical protein [Pseudomonas kilonensis]UVM61371.1 hypothetical protein LOY50_28355 [Pseudomonas sp. B21-010]WPN63491.1 hypothetical protein QMK48_28100 [Pseudomonas sp. P9_32]WPN69244.1 hypothetical protein QMK47_00375 [Pseudomonas sp. P9_35]